jgi:hypothetical protein
MAVDMGVDMTITSDNADIRVGDLDIAWPLEHSEDCKEGKSYLSNVLVDSNAPWAAPLACMG